MGYHIPQALLSSVTLFPSTEIEKVTSKRNCSRSTTNFSYEYILVFYIGQFASHDIKLCGDAMHKCAEGVIMTILTGRGPRSPGSIEFLLLIWTGYFNLGSSWLSKEGTWLHIKVQRQAEDIMYVLKLKTYAEECILKNLVLHVKIRWTTRCRQNILEDKWKFWSLLSWIITEMLLFCLHWVPPLELTGAKIKRRCTDVISGSVISPRWLFCCCDQWKRDVRWGLSSSPSLGAGSSAPVYAETWESCKETAEETVGWRTCPLRPSAPGCCLLPGTKKTPKNSFFPILFEKIKIKPATKHGRLQGWNISSLKREKEF